MADGKTLRVLLCDDEPGMRLILRKLVERAEGFEIVGEAEDGEEGLRLFEEKRPDVVFLDVDMPRLNGVETAKRIQDMDPRAALIFATAYEGYRDEAFEVYAFDYLVKPFKNERVLATLERIRGLLAGSDRAEPPRDLKPRPAARKRRDHIRTALLRKLRKLRFFFNHLEEVIVNDVRLFQLRRKAINLRPVFAVKICHIRDHGGREKRFAVFPPDHNKDFAEYPHVIFVNYPEDQRYRRFLP